MLKPEEIKNEQFELSVLGGYKREQVDTFFLSVVSDYEKLYNENSELINKLKVCVEKIEEYQKDEQFLKAAIINAEKLNETSLKNIELKEKEIETAAREKADNIVEKAQLEAENIVKTAKLEAADAIRQCEIETASKIAELKKAQESEELHLADLKKEVSDFKEMILKLYEKHLSSLSKLPSYEQKVKEQPISFDEPVAQTVANEADLHKEEIAQSTEEVIEKEESSDFTNSDCNAESTNEKTAEFVLEKAAQSKPAEGEFENNFKFQGLKFGTDFDIKKDN